MLIAVPSKDRADTFQEKTLQVLGDHNFTLFVEPQEADEYAEWDPVVIPENDKGMCYVVAYIKNYALENGHDYVLKIDDDVEELDVDKLIKEAEYLFDKYDNVGAVSCTRNSADNYRFMFVDHPLESVFVIRTDLMTDIKDKDASHDGYQSKKIWDEGYKIVQTGITLKNHIGRLINIPPEGYSELTNNFQPLTQGTEEEVQKLLCKKS